VEAGTTLALTLATGALLALGVLAMRPAGPVRAEGLPVALSLRTLEPATGMATEPVLYFAQADPDGGFPPGGFGFSRSRALLALYASRLPDSPDRRILTPVQGARVRDVADTFRAPRGGGRIHEGQDIFARRGTPVVAATDGYVWRTGYGSLGGHYLFIVGAGARRYYYAHLDSYAAGIVEGRFVRAGEVIGYVGNSGNAVGTPPHLHFGIYFGSRRTGDYAVIDPLPLMVDRLD
jgi:murein DD-endopeptidase MepM/ murein hydrolase activator NlpD